MAVPLGARRLRAAARRLARTGLAPRRDDPGQARPRDDGGTFCGIGQGWCPCPRIVIRAKTVGYGRRGFFSGRPGGCRGWWQGRVGGEERGGRGGSEILALVGRLR